MRWIVKTQTVLREALLGMSAEEELARETGDPMDDIRDGDGNQVAAGEKAGTEAGSPDVSDH